LNLTKTMKILSRNLLLCSSLFLLSGCVVICVGGKGDKCPCCNPASVEHDKDDAPAKPQASAGHTLFNVDFGPWRGSESEQTGPAAIGRQGDYWNTVGQPFNDAHTEGDLKWADGKASPIKVEMRNLGGGWGFSGGLGLTSKMLDNFNYPANNKGGNSHVVLHNVPAGKYDLFIYGHGTQADYFGDYSVKSGETTYGRRTTYAEDNSGQDAKWIENRQYVKFSDIKVGDGEPIEILIRPGNPVEANGRTISDAIIAGLQLARR